MPLVSDPASFARRAERLAWAGAGPDRPVIRPSGEAEGVGPDPDPSEEIALGEAGEVARLDIFD